MDEGSVLVDGFDSDVSESETTESTETTESEETGSTQDTDSQEEGETLTSKKDEAEYTEKGTKLDKDPQSRLNQELANERAKARQYEEVLNNPKLLKSYLAQFEPEKPAETETNEPEMRVEDVQTTADLHKFLAQENRKVQSKMRELDDTIKHVKGTQEDTAIATKISGDVIAVREKYPELNPYVVIDGKKVKNPDFNEDLDKRVGDLYEKLDFDPKAKAFRGKISLAEIADVIMGAAGAMKKQGSQEAQTMIKDKRSGKAVSGATETHLDISNMSPGQIISARIKAAKRR
jgi:hypothetical protein